ncbi:hypothetical protein EHQ58_06925 [Leptospira ognonensis]|uniref:Uncharacterized protein n=2 Tax=Leptospira ognonensis TaxID=2484945 RepID=A0A4R9K6N0_9LEPT|nr:hypothetical protein EHQ58_06925 [Leptospira ognonensis]
MLCGHGLNFYVLANFQSSKTMTIKMIAYHFNKKFYVFSLIFISFFSFCKPLNLRKDCDPTSLDFLKISLLVQYLQIRSAGCYPPFFAANIDPSVASESAPNSSSEIRVPLWGFFSINAGAGLVRDIKINGTKAYVGGVFDYIGPNTGSLAMLNGSDQVLLPQTSCPYFEIDGNVNRILSDGNGNAFVAGTFNHIFGIPRRAIAKIKADCSIDTTFNVNMADSGADVRTLLLHNGKLYLGGVFSGTFATTGSDTRTHLAAVNPSSGALDTSWNPVITGGEVNDIQTDNTDLYVGGQFSQIGGSTLSNLARINLTTGTVVNALGDPDGTVQSIFLEGTNLYVGGSFTTISSNTANYLAKIGNSGSFIWGNTQLDSTVRSVYISNNKLYVAGNFSTPRQSLITFDPTTGSDLTKDFKILSGLVTMVREVDNKIFLIGSFTSILDTSIPYVASIDPTNDTLVSWNANIGGPNQQDYGDILKFSNGNYLVGGSFPTLQGKARSYLAEMDLTTGQPTDWNPSFTHPGGIEVIQAMHIYQDQLYIGGAFTAIGGQTRTRFASFDIKSTPSLSNLSISISGYTNNVYRISNFDNNILITGGYATVNGTSINHIVTLNPENNQLTFGLNPNTNFSIKDFIKLSNGKLVLGGDFTQINGSTAINRFAVVNESNGNLLQSPSGTAIGSAYSLVESNGRLIIGFDNNSAPGGSTGCCLGIYDIDNFNPITHSLNILPASGQRVNYVYANSSELFFMGTFNSVRSQTKSNFAAVLSDTLQLTDFSPTFNSEVYRMGESTTDYFFLGRFSAVSGRKRSYLARIRKSDKSLVN